MHNTHNFNDFFLLYGAVKQKIILKVLNEKKTKSSEFRVGKITHTPDKGRGRENVMFPL